MHLYILINVYTSLKITVCINVRVDIRDWCLTMCEWTEKNGVKLCASGQRRLVSNYVRVDRRDW
jgi:hypothetical protein